ncbi:hypothetical protein GT20_0291 [Parageobacillus thermoglucosidasius TNO-09.020]|nr:hypothetical protein GT20_0291 [Parageobacillus thermoglucosidasius TNO-09.020]
MIDGILSGMRRRDWISFFYPSFLFLASKKCMKWQLKMPLAKFRYWLSEIESL